MDIGFTSIKYELASGLGLLEESRYINKITSSLFITDEMGEPTEKIGYLKLYQLILDWAYEDGYSAYNVFDHTSNTFQIGELVYDFEESNWKDEILEFYDDAFLGSDILIVDRINILPKYRGNGLSKKLIKDAIKRFGNSCSLVVLKSFPLQFDAYIKNHELGEWDKNMGYAHFEKDTAKANKKLLAFYKSIGFQQIKGIDSKILFLNLALKNKKFNAICLEDV